MATIIAIPSSNVRFFSGATAPADTSGRTIWLNTSTSRMCFYWDGAWHAMNTYQ